MTRPALQLSDIFRQHGPSYRDRHRGSLSYQQLAVMHAIEVCRTAALGGHVEECDACGHRRVSYNSCRNRHCNKCQSFAKAQWLERRQADLLPVEYFHVVFSVPAQIAAIAYQNKKVVYGILFRAVADTLRSIAADPKRLGAEIGVLAVLHTWGQTLEFHPHIHCIVTGGGLALDGKHWISCRRRFFLPVRVLSSRFRRLFMRYLNEAYRAGNLQFFTGLEELSQPAAWLRYLQTVPRKWVVYAKAPFGGPQQVLDYLGRYTHRVAISNDRLLGLSEGRVSFHWKDYRDHGRQKVMSIEVDEFIRRFLLHVLPKGFQRIRQYGLLGNRSRVAKLARCRELLAATISPLPVAKLSIDAVEHCPICGQGHMRRIGIVSPSPVEDHVEAAGIDSS